MARRRARKATTPRRKHPLKADKTLGQDILGNQWCTRCNHMGRPGDARHTGDDDFPPDPMPATPPAAREIEDRMLGEAS